MKLGKAPGMDGLTLEFYWVFRSELAPYLVELYRYCLQNLVIPASWKEARLAIFPKKGKDARYPEAYKPISILNMDYKILATILAIRLNSIMGTYNSP